MPELIQTMMARPIDRKRTALPSGLSLELSLKPPPQPSDGNKLAVLLHPWSRLGGNMNDPVLRHFFHILHDHGFHIVLYNSRGVGKSSGWPSFTGLQEGKDLQEVVQWGLSYVSDVRHVLIIGYSYGALIATQHPVLPKPIKTSHILLSYPLDKRGLLTLFHSSSYIEALKGLAEDPASEILLVFGDKDEFTGIDSYEAWAAELQRNAGQDTRATHGKVRAELVKGATHFWEESKAERMCEVVERWLCKSS